MDWQMIGIGVAVVAGLCGLGWLLSKAEGTSGGSRSDGSGQGVGMTVGSDGVSPHLDVSDSVGIDLKDGSITVGSGPVKWDLDGSGPKFKF